uniref:Mitochondrial inner membrane protease subunit 2 n=1 Tax=Aegilops tauschii subsp. strangulata TaxID=200361 RepID=A0A452XBI2_AEGTS
TAAPCAPPWTAPQQVSPPPPRPHAPTTQPTTGPDRIPRRFLTAGVTPADGREYAVVKRSPLYDYSRGEVVVFVSPADHRSRTIKRLIGLPGDWISVPDKEEIRQIPEGHCWVEGDNGSASWDSRSYGPGAAWSGAGEGDTRGVATQQDGPRRQEGAAGRKGHAAAKSLVQLSSFLAGLVALSCSFVGSCRKIM